MTFGNKIKDLRQKRELSQSELGKMVDVHYTHIGKYESNSSLPSVDTIRKIANTFEVSIDYLLNDESENEVKTSFNDLDLLKQFKRVEHLSDDDKDTIKKFLDAFLVKSDLQKMIKN